MFPLENCPPADVSFHLIRIPYGHNSVVLILVYLLAAPDSYKVMLPRRRFFEIHSRLLDSRIVEGVGRIHCRFPSYPLETPSSPYHHKYGSSRRGHRMHRTRCLYFQKSVPFLYNKEESVVAGTFLLSLYVFEISRPNPVRVIL